MTTFLERLGAIENNGTKRKRGRPAKQQPSNSTGNNAVNREPDNNRGSIDGRSASDSNQRGTGTDSGNNNVVGNSERVASGTNGTNGNSSVKPADELSIGENSFVTRIMGRTDNGGNNAGGSSTNAGAESKPQPANGPISVNAFNIPVAGTSNTGSTEPKKRGRPAGTATKGKADTAISAEFISELMETGFSLIASQKGQHWIRSKEDCKDVSEPAARIIDKMPKEQIEKVMLFADPLMLVFGLYLLVQPAIAEDVKIQNEAIRTKRTKLSNPAQTDTGNFGGSQTDDSTNRNNSFTESTENPYSFNNIPTTRN